MTRVTQHKSRQVIITSGGTLEDGLHIEELALFDQDGEPVSLGGGYRRAEYIHNTASLAPGAQEATLLTLWPSWRLFKVATNRPARIRIYATAEQRDADLNRALGSKPYGNHGRLFELVTSSDILEYTLSPVVDLSSDDESSNFYATVTNRDSVAGVVTTTYHHVRTE